MSQQEAEQLVEDINAAPGWHAAAEEDIWQGGWRVRAWLDEMGNGEDDFYGLHGYAEWRRVVASLAEEARLADVPLPVVAVDDLPF